MQWILLQARMGLQRYGLEESASTATTTVIVYLPKLKPRIPPLRPALASKLPFILRSDGEGKLP